MNIDQNFILSLYAQHDTVFTVNRISQLFPDISQKSILDRLHYFTKTGKLQRVRHGIYAKHPYEHYELVNKLYTPSYISLETVLRKAGVIFQQYETIFAVSYITRALTVSKVHIQYRKIPDNILTNPAGIFQENGYTIATPERAFLDAVYIYKNYHFDHLGALDWNTIHTLMGMYKTRAFEKRLAIYESIYKEDYGRH